MKRCFSITLPLIKTMTENYNYLYYLIYKVIREKIMSIKSSVAYATRVCLLLVYIDDKKNNKIKLVKVGIR